MSDGHKRCRKAIPEVEKDRLGALPDSLLLDIIGRLDLKEAAKTAALSKQWRFLWTNLPLQFEDMSEEIENRRRFVDRVNAALLAVGNTASHAFSVSFVYSDCFASDVDSWLDFAAKNKVQDLSLDPYLPIDDDGNNKVRYTLPQFMFSNSSLTVLELESCIVKPRTKVDWPRLKELTLDGVKLRQREIEKILSGCPVLEWLRLDVYGGIKRLEMGGRSLKDLELDLKQCRGLLEISAPYLTSLSLAASPKTIGRRKVVLETVPSLETTQIHIYNFGLHSLTENVTRNAMQLLQDLRHLNALHLSQGCNKVLSLMVTNGWRLPQLRVKDLHIGVARDMHNIYGVLAMLESSPYVDKLVLHVSSELHDHKDSIKWGSIKRDYLRCDLLHLKIVQFIDVVVNPNHLRKPTSTMARIILNRAPILEEIVIFKRPSTSPEQIDIIKNRLLNYPKSSVKVSVKLEFYDDADELVSQDDDINDLFC